MVLPEAADSPDLCQYLKDILSSVGGEPHRTNHKTGVGLKNLEQFEHELDAYLNWTEQAALSKGQSVSSIMPLGDATPEAFEVLTRLETKLDDYFLRCDVARFGLEEASRDRHESAEESTPTLKAQLDRAPLASPNPKGFLTFEGLLNPAYEADLLAFRETVAAPLLGRRPQTLNATQWRELKQQFIAHRRWRAEQPDVTLGSIPAERLQRYRSISDFAVQVRTLIEDSYRTSRDLEDLRQLERLLLYRVHLLSVARSFVSFTDLYDPGQRALFEMGTLCMEGRRFQFSVRVEERARHVRFSNASHLFVIYAEISGGDGGRLYEVAVPVTWGGKGNLQVGSLGLFVDRQGRELNARLVEVVENPIRVWPVLALPFFPWARRDLSGMLEGAGWGINTRMALTPALARTFTQRPGLPWGASGASGVWWIVFGLAALLAGLFLYSAL